MRFYDNDDDDDDDDELDREIRTIFLSSLSSKHQVSDKIREGVRIDKYRSGIVGDNDRVIVKRSIYFFFLSLSLSLSLIATFSQS